MSLLRVLCAVLGLGAAVLFYVGYRSEYTLSNRLIGYLCGPDAYLVLKHELRHWLPLSGVLRGCLPSALWCFVGTSLFGAWKIRLESNRELSGAWLFPSVNAFWEIIQWAGWTDGRADWRDTVAGFVGAMIAHAIFLRASMPRVEVYAWWSWRISALLVGIASMGFADVWK